MEMWELLMSISNRCNIKGNNTHFIYLKATDSYRQKADLWVAYEHNVNFTACSETKALVRRMRIQLYK